MTLPLEILSEVTLPSIEIVARTDSVRMSQKRTVLSKWHEMTVVTVDSDTTMSLQIDAGNKVFVPVEIKKNHVAHRLHQRPVVSKSARARKIR